MGNRRNDPSGHGAESGPIDSFKPLIRIGNVTYRIGRLRYGHYEVVRILDEVQLGTFECYPTLTVTSSIIHPAFILSIARAAARAARPSWIYRISHAFRRHSSAPPSAETPETHRNAPGGAGAPPDNETAAPPDNRTAAPPDNETAAPPDNRTAAPPDNRTAAPPDNETAGETPGSKPPNRD